MHKKPNLSFLIDEALDRRITAEVKRTGLSRSDVARTAIRAALGASKKEKAHATR